MRKKKNDENQNQTSRKRIFDVKKKRGTVEIPQILKESFIPLGTLKEKFLKAAARKGLKETTIKTYSQIADSFIKFCENTMHIQNPKNIDKDIIEMFINHLREKGVSDIYVNTNLRNLKPFFTWLTENGYIEINPFNGIKLLKTDKKRKQVLSNEELQAILKQIDLLSFAGVRDWLMVQILYGCALRISACCSLKLKDVDLERRTIYIENSKNREDSFIPFPESLVKPLKKYIKQYFHNMSQDSYLFPNLYGERLSRETFLKNLKRYGKKAGIPHVTCHLLRHSFAVNCLMNGASTATVRRLLRHRDLKTVEEYIHWLPQNVQEQFDKFNPLDQMYLNPN